MAASPSRTRHGLAQPGQRTGVPTAGEYDRARQHRHEDEEAKGLNDGDRRESPAGDRPHDEHSRKGTRHLECENRIVAAPPQLRMSHTVDTTQIATMPKTSATRLDG